MDELHEHQIESDSHYRQSGKWKCLKSPTGAHQWSIITTIDKGFSIDSYACRMCGGTKLVLRKVY